MVSFGQSVNFLVALSSCVFTFFVTSKLVSFLSVPSKVPLHQVWIVNLLDDYSRLQSVIMPLLMNLSWSGLFILQHSFMKSPTLTKFLLRIGLYHSERAIFNAASCGCLLLLLDNWRKVPEVTLWEVNVKDNDTYWFLFIITHVVAWLVVFGGLLMMDFPEFLGIKHVYFNMNNMEHPMTYKSRDLKRLYGRVRHPSFLALTIVLWAINLMTLDRLMLAVIWSLYMYFAWATDHNDVYYSKFQMKRKRAEIYNQIVQ